MFGRESFLAASETILFLCGKRKRGERTGGKWSCSGDDDGEAAVLDSQTEKRSLFLSLAGRDQRSSYSSCPGCLGGWRGQQLHIGK